MLTTIVTIQWVLDTSLKYVFWASSESCSKSYWTLCKALRFAQNKTIDQVKIKTTANIPFVAFTRIAPEFPERAKHPEKLYYILFFKLIKRPYILSKPSKKLKAHCYIQTTYGFLS